MIFLFGTGIRMESMIQRGNQSMSSLLLPESLFPSTRIGSHRVLFEAVTTIWIYEPIKSRYYYYAHLKEIFLKIGQIVSRGERIGTVGRTGKNAYPMRSPTHLHFTVHRSAEGCPMPVDPYRELVRGLEKSLDIQEKR